jgi:flagellar hook protein FlgE
MSINSAMLSGVSGLIANSAALGAISDNIANVNTVGYKENSTQFEDLVSASATAGNYNSGGVQANVSQLISQQGQFTQTQSGTDLAINGAGFFVVSSTAAGLSSTSGPTFTRAGSFTPDANGNLENTAGLYLQGWAADSSGNITTSPSDLTKLSTININSVADAPNPTTTASANFNLDASTTATTGYTAGAMASGAITPSFTTGLTVFDGQGGQHTVNLDFLKTGSNTWQVEAVSQPASDVSSTNGLVGSTTLTFDSNGALVSGGQLPLTLNYTDTGLGSQSIALDLGGGGSTGAATQFATASTVNSTTGDGGLPGTLTKVSVGTDGKVTADFSNGATRTIAQVAVATFPDPNGLTAASGNAYQATNQSGTFNLKQPQVGDAGSIQSDELEGSTVDLSTEFTNLIITQRAYSAASKIITTADQMLQELIAVKQ